MHEKMKDDYKISFIRGATTASGNSVREIEVAVVELIDELISRNNLIKTNILSITFTATNDLTKINIYLSLILQHLLNKGALLHNSEAIKLEPLFLYRNRHHWIRTFVGSLKRQLNQVH